MRFDELDLSDSILDALDEMGFQDCTPIQEQAIPKVLEGNDLIAVAQTGTGKTAAYLLPVIDLLYTLPEPENHINCIVMAPTRELAQQIDRQLEGLAYYLPLSSVAVYGGTDGKVFAQQEHAIRSGADIVIATPGRLLAHMQMGYVDLSKVAYFILDEADRMLDMGFYDDIMRIVNKLPKERQTLMFSATMPEAIRRLAGQVLRPERAEVRIAPSRPASGIRQSAVKCDEGEKERVLRWLLKERHSNRVIVFTASKSTAKDLARTLKRSGIKAADIHSDKEQSERDEVMIDFRANRLDVLVATDILARGIDIDDIAMVVNYDVPHEAEDYVHRIGRTARAGQEGEAVTFVGPRDRRRFALIEKFLGKPVPELEGIEVRNSGDSADGSRRRDDRRGGGRGDNRGRDNRGGNRSKGPRKPQGSRAADDARKSAPKPADGPAPKAAAAEGSVVSSPDGSAPSANPSDGANRPSGNGQPRKKRRYNHHGKRGPKPSDGV